jgi:molybdopterin synthase sulfur carrier subunit
VGERAVVVPGGSVAEVLAAAVARFGPALAERLPSCRVWVNGEPVDPGATLGPEDEVAVLPPVSGG